ncbi:MAG: 2-oxoglutarate dehydrogenase E1 component, partial [Dehalococcoidia bacterium]|nr:2-oxoglutarate dehydrogenase E1 component [Dehalococcoidia bacterium]
MTDFDFIARANPEWVEAQYRAWRRDPRSVDERWALVFAGFDFAGGRGPAAAPPAVDDLVHSYRELGYLAADLDPLGSSPREHPLLRLEEFGFSERDLGRIVHPGSFRGLG